MEPITWKAWEHSPVLSRVGFDVARYNTLLAHTGYRTLARMLDSVFSVAAPAPHIDQTIDAQREPFNEDNWTRRLRGLHRAAVRLDELAGSTHVGLAHSWKFIGGRFMLPSVERIQHCIRLVTPTHTRLVEIFSATLYLYRNLRSLCLEALVIDAHFRQTLSELSRLENLTLRSCHIVARDGFVMSLRSFTISTPHPAHTTKVARGPLRILAPDSVHILHLDAADETAPILAAFRRAQLLRLVVLSMQHLTDLNMFVAFLAQCPGLEVLKITTVHADVIVSLPQYTLSHVAIPALRDLTVHVGMLGIFSLNRPVTAVTILNQPPTRRRLPAPPVEDFTPAVLNDLSTTSAPLLSLSINQTSTTLQLFAAITSLFPQLQQLSIHLPQPRSGRIYYPYDHARRSRSTSVDNRCPALRDADVFKDIPEEVPSDVEEVVLDWICSGAASLPQEIEFLRLIWNER
ncbi:hypothetical protein C8R45DRAFT_946965 [Mycena sanguinolenta]|nr:hypothetical protein C8R45DRAFT_946965 [Mycena sanguinolenta]